MCPDAFHDSLQLNAHRCDPNTQVIVLEKIKDWILDKTHPDSHLMWLSGEEKSGKSAIARTIAEWCESQKILLSSFFFSRTNPATSCAKSFVATVAYEIAQSVRSFQTLIEQAVDENPHVFSRSLSTQAVKLILEPFMQVIQSSDARTLPHVIVIDALDECVQWAEQKAIIDILSSKFMLYAPQWKILVCSRPEPKLSRLLFDLESKSMLIWAPLVGQYRSTDTTVNDFHDNTNLKGEIDSIFKMAGLNEVSQAL